MDDLRAALARHRPRLRDGRLGGRAAVALVLRGGEVELLFIERAQRSGDPWSGHMAFPGGYVDPGDPDARHAAERETLEEVGIDLETADLIGRLDDIEGAPVGRPALVVSAFVYALPRTPALRLNHEVREALWIPLRALVEPGRAVPYERMGGGIFPGIRVGAAGPQVVWGLTHHFVRSFFGVLGLELPTPVGVS
jgi:8-oxo-dGTP pyrophosphatase MutT (NUDIX family)